MVYRRRHKFRLSTKKRHTTKWQKLEGRLKKTVPHKLAPWFGVRATIDISQFVNGKWHSSAVTEEEAWQETVLTDIVAIALSARHHDWSRFVAANRHLFTNNIQLEMCADGGHCVSRTSFADADLCAMHNIRTIGLVCADE